MNIIFNTIQQGAEGITGRDDPELGGGAGKCTEHRRRA